MDNTLKVERVRPFPPGSLAPLTRLAHEPSWAACGLAQASLLIKWAKQLLNWLKNIHRAESSRAKPAREFWASRPALVALRLASLMSRSRRDTQLLLPTIFVIWWCANPLLWYATPIIDACKPILNYQVAFEHCLLLSPAPLHCNHLEHKGHSTYLDVRPEEDKKRRRKWY